ncbi:MAG: DUF2231 domain-containing protein [Aeromicrobium sp.]
MTIAGLPLHPLVVHAAVVLAPLAAIVALAHSLVPRWRWALRHVSALAAILAALSVQVAAMTGDSLAASEAPVSKLVRVHEAWAGRLEFSVWVLAAVVIVAWWFLPHESPLPGHARSPRAVAWAPVVNRAVIALMPTAALATLVLVAFTGHAGAEAVWARA